jgi:hypothetical protein
MYKRAKEKTAEDHKLEVENLNTAHAAEIEGLNAVNAAVLAALNQELSQANQDRVEAEGEVTRHGWLLTMLRESVGFKRQRIAAVTLAKARPSIPQVRAALAPWEQVRILLEALASLLRLQAVQQYGVKQSHNFRIGLVSEKDGGLVPLAAFDLATKSHEPFSSYAKYADRYKLDNYRDTALAVRCIQEGRALIVADCAAEAGFYFHARQQNYLRSIIAFPIDGFCPDGVNQARAALLIDTDVCGFFSEDDREMLELLLREFVARIDLEDAISGLTG